MYIADFINLGVKHGLVQLYISDQNSMVFVTNSLYKVLYELKNKYGDSTIDLNDPQFCKIMDNVALFKRLYDLKLFIEDKTYTEVKYSEKSYDVRDVYIHVTRACNLHCQYCYFKENLNSKFHMSYNVLNKVLSSEKFRGAHYIITGGEPLLHPNFVDFIDLIKKSDCSYCTLLTNGTLIHRYKKEVSCFDSIIVSLDSFGSSQRKGLDSKYLFETLIRLPSYIKEKIIVRSVVSLGELEEIEKLSIALKENNLKHVRIARLPNSQEEISLMPTIEECTNSASNTNQFMTRCGAAYSVLAVDYNGDIFPCQSLVKPKFCLGNICSTQWWDLLQERRIVLGFDRPKIFKNNQCSTCSVKYLCGGGCPAITENVYADKDAWPEFLCNQYKSIVLDKLKKISLKL